MSKFRVGKACNESWSKMAGSDCRRVCERCSHEVHHVDALSETERAELVQRRASGEKICIALTTVALVMTVSAGAAESPQAKTTQAPATSAAKPDDEVHGMVMGLMADPTPQAVPQEPPPSPEAILKPQKKKRH